CKDPFSLFRTFSDALSAIFGLSELKIGIKSQDTIMLDSEDSTVTYTAVSSPFEDRSDIGSPGVDGPPIMPEDPYAYIVAAYQAPPSPDYMPSPEEPQSPPLLDFVPEPMYPECMPLEDEILPAEEQPLPVAASPTTDSPGYVPESDPEEELEEDDEDPEEDLADYPTDRDDDEEEEEEEPSGDDADDEDEDEDEDEVEEHPAPVDSVLPVHSMTARISIWDEPSISLPLREEVKQLLALTTPPPSPLTPLSSPLHRYHSPPTPKGSSHCICISALPLPTSSPPLQLLSSDRRADRPEITLPPRKRLGIDLGPRCEVGESSAAAAARPIRGRRADYGFVDTVDAKISRRRAEEVGYGIREAWVDLIDAAEEVALTTLEGVNTKVTELAAVQEQDTHDIYGVIEDTQDQEALVSQEAWGHSMKVSYMARSEIMALRSIVMSQQTVISQLQAADRRSQIVTSEMLQADHMRTDYHSTGTGDSTAGTAGTLWRSSTARSGYHQKDRKPSQNDKTEHGMEKTVQNQGQSPKMSKSESILKNQQSNRSRN
ncbi:hypothetical protein Tco_1075281, partial [Tanacetum coccineum]